MKGSDFMKLDNLMNASLCEVMDKAGRGILYLCPTPIGNMGDMTIRALQVLDAVHYVAAEDTRHSGKLLAYFEIDKPLISYHEHNKQEKGDYLLDLLLEGKSVALVSDAGMPAISDPGEDILRRALEAQIKVVPLPGANAALTALIASGLDTTEFTFVGFLPKRKNHRLDRLEALKSYKGTLIFYEAPHRLEEVLGQMFQVLGNRPIVIGRELTKRFETFTRGTLEEVLSGEIPLVVKGEFVILLGASQRTEEEEGHQSQEMEVSLVDAVQHLIDGGLSKKEAIRQVANERNLARRDVYNSVEAAMKEGTEHV